MSLLWPALRVPVDAPFLANLRGAAGLFSSGAGSRVPGASPRPPVSSLGKGLQKYNISNCVGLDCKLESSKTRRFVGSQTCSASFLRTQIKATGAANGSLEKSVHTWLTSDNRSFREATAMAFM